MILKPQDVLVQLKLVAIGSADWSYNRLALSLGMSAAEVHAAAKRAVVAGLAYQDEGSTKPLLTPLEEFIFHGLRYVFVPDRGPLTRGIPTAHAAPPLAGLMLNDGEPPPVWPVAEGTIRGSSFSPLYKSAPLAAANDEMLYELLALVDAIRGGRARERQLAMSEMKERFAQYGRLSQSQS